MTEQKYEFGLDLPELEKRTSKEYINTKVLLNLILLSI